MISIVEYPLIGFEHVRYISSERRVSRNGAKIYHTISFGAHKLMITLPYVDLRLVLKKFEFRYHILSRRISSLRMQIKKEYPELVRYPFLLTCSTCVPRSARIG